MVERIELLCAVARQRVEGAAADQRIECFAIELARVDTLGEVEDVGEASAGLARFDDRPDGALAHAFDGRQTETNVGSDDGKRGARLVDVGG